MKYKLSVAEALEKLKAAEPLEQYQIDFANDKVEALDAMQLTKAGFQVPEAQIYYDDDAIEYDEAFEGDWKRVATDGLAEAESKLSVDLYLAPEIKAWLDQQTISSAQLIEKLLKDCYTNQQLISKQV